MKNPVPQVKPALPGDADFLMEMLRHNCEEEHAIARPSDDCIRAILNRGLTQEMAMIGVIRGPDRIEGSVGIYVSSWWFSHDLHCDALWLYVHPEHRRSEHAKNLIKFAKWAAAELSFPLVLGILKTPQTDRKAELYGRQIPLGGSFFIHKAGDVAA